MTLQTFVFRCKKDNIGVLLHNLKNDRTLLIDAPDESAILNAIQKTGWRPSAILITHHHSDHIEANGALKERFGLKIFGPLSETHEIPEIDEVLADGDEINLLEEKIKIIKTPGHTKDHIAFHLEKSKILFTGDCLFPLGCGRLFECSPQVMHTSLLKISALDPETKIYSGHEYTFMNAHFARTLDPKNKQLEKALESVQQRMSQNKNDIIITTLKEELETNPFLRTHDKEIRENLGMLNDSDDAVFAKMRHLKDQF